MKWMQLQHERKDAEGKLQVLQEKAMANVTRIRERLGQLRTQTNEFEGEAAARRGTSSASIDASFELTGKPATN